MSAGPTKCYRLLQLFLKLLTSLRFGSDMAGNTTAIYFYKLSVPLQIECNSKVDYLAHFLREDLLECIWLGTLSECVVETVSQILCYSKKKKKSCDSRQETREHKLIAGT